MDMQHLNSIQDTYEVDEEAAHSIAMEEARAYAFLENMDETINSLERARNIALKYDPPRMDMEAIYLLMNCYLNNDILDKVVECARELKKANGEDYYSLAAYYYEPFALKKLGKQEEAKKLFEEAVTYFRSASLKIPVMLIATLFAFCPLGNWAIAKRLLNWQITLLRSKMIWQKRIH